MRYLVTVEMRGEMTVYAVDADEAAARATDQEWADLNIQAVTPTDVEECSHDDRSS